jgi:acetyl esterase/lipase
MNSRIRCAALATVGLLVCNSLLARPPAGKPVLLWADGAPGALGQEPQDRPTLTPYWPAEDAATGAALLICPGGGYGHLADHEGAGYARFYNQHGITAFVLKYRLGSDGYRHPVMLQDAARGLRLIRSQAVGWGLDPQRIGIIGSSAGGHLASTLLTHFDAGDPEAGDAVERVSSRPDLGLLCYPVISMATITHGGSRRNLLGPAPTPELIELLSNERQVTSNTPPCFVWHTVEDPAVKVENSLQFGAALAKAGVPFELHLYERGRHGIGLGQSDGASSDTHPWAGESVRWLRLHGFAR